MCGRYVTKDQAAMERAFSVVKPWWRFEASYNVAPTQSVPIIRLAEGEREGVMMRWGLGFAIAGEATAAAMHTPRRQRTMGYSPKPSEQSALHSALRDRQLSASRLRPVG